MSMQFVANVDKAVALHIAGFIQILEKFGKKSWEIFKALKSLENDHRYGKVWKKSLKSIGKDIILSWKSMENYSHVAVRPLI